MLNRAFSLWTIAVLASTLTPAFAQQPAALVTPAEITITDDASAEADADKVSGLVDTMTNNIRACIKTRQASPQECQCKFPDNLDRVKIAYDQALRLHPDWEGKMVTYKKGTAPPTSVSFSNLKTQMETCSAMEKAQ